MITSRKSLGLVNATSITQMHGPVDTVYIHHSVTAKAPTASTWRNIQSYHMGNRGWTDIAYNFGAAVTGEQLEGRGWGRVGGATGSGKDSSSYSICALGNFEQDNVTAALVNAIVGIIKTGIKNGEISANPKILGHRDSYSTACPGSKLYEAIGEIRALVTASASVVTPEPEPAAFNAPPAWWEDIEATKDGNDPSDIIALWQFLLTRFGHDVTVDGVKGPQTRAAHEEFELARWPKVANDAPGNTSWGLLLAGPTLQQDRLNAILEAASAAGKNIEEVVKEATKL